MKELTKWVNEVLEMVNRPKFTYQNMQKKERLIIGLAGGLQSGKDATASILINRYGFKKLAFADALRDSLYKLNPIIIQEGEELHSRLQFTVDQIGWERAKVEYPEVRRLLQVLGTESGREIHGYNCWADIVAIQLDENPTQDYVITDLRFPNELQLIHDYNGKTARMSRKGFEPKGNHASEMWLEGVQYSIPNDGTLEDLERYVEIFYEGFKNPPERPEPA